MAHINMLKAWNLPDASLLGMVVVAEEEDGSQEQGKALAELPALMGRQNDEVGALLAEYNDVVRQEVGRARDICHEIDTGNEKPIRTFPYRLAPAWRDQLREEVRVLQGSGTVVPSTSPWSSPMVPVRKPDGTIRLCIDFRKLNHITKPDPYLMPHIDEMIDQLGEAHYLSKLDLNKGIYQIRLAQLDLEKTAFCVPWGEFHFTMMPFGLRNAPASFQTMMDRILDDIQDFSGAYMDDIIIFSQTWEDHMAHIKCVLDRLRKAGLMANPAKCQCGSASLTFLGYTVGRGKVSTPDYRVEAIRNSVRHITKKDVQSFLGTTGYYRKFIPNDAHNSIELANATWKSAPYVVCWFTAMNDEFYYLCHTLSQVSSLTIPTPTDTFFLQTNASTKGIAGVLNVVREEVELPVGFYSRKLHPAEARYSAPEVECLAIVRSIQHYGIYLVGKPFTVETDHKALTHLHSSTHLNGRLTQWALLLQPYNFTTHYRPGQENGNAGGLSRQAWDGDQNEERERQQPFQGGGEVRPQP